MHLPPPLIGQSRCVLGEPAFEASGVDFGGAQIGILGSTAKSGRDV